MPRLSLLGHVQFPVAQIGVTAPMALFLDPNRASYKSSCVWMPKLSYAEYLSENPIATCSRVLELTE